MTTTYFNYASYREFLAERFKFLKGAKRQFSARYLAKRAKVNSPSYFNLVVKGQRKLSLEYAKRFSRGLELNEFEQECLLTSVALENCSDQREKTVLLTKLDKLKKLSSQNDLDMHSEQIRILSEPFTLKLYLLAQRKDFEFSHKWLMAQFSERIAEQKLNKGIESLIASGLWLREKNSVTVCAPSLRSGDNFTELNLLRTHQNMVASIKRNLETVNPENRALGARTFLFDKKRLPEVRKHFDEFKRHMESEFEDLNAKEVYQLHLSFFELDP